jgi:hypothetical protein
MMRCTIRLKPVEVKDVLIGPASALSTHCTRRMPAVAARNTGLWLRLPLGILASPSATQPLRYSGALEGFRRSSTPIPPGGGKHTEGRGSSLSQSCAPGAGCRAIREIRDIREICGNFIGREKYGKYAGISHLIREIFKKCPRTQFCRPNPRISRRCCAAAARAGFRTDALVRPSYTGISSILVRKMREIYGNSKTGRRSTPCPRYALELVMFSWEQKREQT